MDSAEDYGRAGGPVFVREFVSAQRHSGDRAYRDQIEFSVIPWQWRHAAINIRDCQIKFRRDERGEERPRERRLAERHPDSGQAQDVRLSAGEQDQNAFPWHCGRHAAAGSEFFVDGFQIEAAREEHDLGVVEKLGDFLGEAFVAFVFGGDPHLARFLEDFFADVMRAAFEFLDGARFGIF